MSSFGGICYWPFAKYEVSGPQAVAFLDRLVPNRRAAALLSLHRECVEAAQRGPLRSLLLPDASGQDRLGSDARALGGGPLLCGELPRAGGPFGALKSRAFGALGGSEEWFDWRWMHQNKPSEGVEVRNVTADYGTLMVSGPESRRVLGELANDPEAWSKAGERL